MGSLQTTLLEGLVGFSAPFPPAGTVRVLGERLDTATFRRGYAAFPEDNEFLSAVSAFEGGGDGLDRDDMPLRLFADRMRFELGLDLQHATKHRGSTPTIIVTHLILKHRPSFTAEIEAAFEARPLPPELP